MNKIRFWTAGFLLCALILSGTAYCETVEFVPTPMNGLALYEIMSEKGEDYYGTYYLEVAENPVFVEAGADEPMEVIETQPEEQSVEQSCEGEELCIEEYTEVVADSEPEIPLYSVNGSTLNPDLQRWAYTCLCDFGIGWYYDIFMCQMYQESRFDQGDVSPHGCYGICQLKIDYHDEWKAKSHIWEGADLINDPYANIYVGAFLMYENFTQTSDLATAISAYYTGIIGDMNLTYVNDVLQWQSTLERIN